VTGPSPEPRDVDPAWWHPDVSTLPVGAPFRPGLDLVPGYQKAWAVVKDRWGRPAHDEPGRALVEIVTPVPSVGPNEALGYVLFAGLTYNTLFAARGIPVSVFDLHDEDAHVPGSGAIVLVAALGSEVAREGRLRVGDVCVLYPGVSNLLSPRAGADPMHADFKIQGYETPDGSFAQFVQAQAPQLLPHSERLTLAEGSSFMLDLETVYKALYDVAGLRSDERVFVEGAAGGTGIYAVTCAVARGACVTGLVSTEAKARLVLERGGHAVINRAAPELAGVFTSVPSDPAIWPEWAARGRDFTALVRDGNGGRAIDVVVSSVGRDLFARMVDLLGEGGRLVFYGATSGYTLTFLGKAGSESAAAMLDRAHLRPGHAVLVYYGAGTDNTAGAGEDPVGTDAIRAAARGGARVAAVTQTDAEAEDVKARLPVVGAVSLEALARGAHFHWPTTMPDSDRDPEAYRAYQDGTVKPLGAAVGRLLASRDNPRGAPDIVVERAGGDTLGVSAFIARPHTGTVVYLESTEGQRLSFYAPNVWMHQKRVLFPTFAILGSHLSNAHQATEVVQLIDAGTLVVHPPAIRAWEELPDAHQAMHENRHAGTLAVRVGATPALDMARQGRQVFETWGSRFIDCGSVRVRIDAVRPGFPELVALVTIAAPPANALSRSTLQNLEQALERLDAEHDVRAVVLTGAGTMFVAGADIRELRACATAQEVRALATRAQRLFTRIAAARAPVISAVDGYALGGGNELQMACAYRVAGARAELGQPEINLHVMPGFGGTQMLPRLAIRGASTGGGQMYTALVAALTALLDGRRRPAPAARALGLVDEVVPADALSRALGVARAIALGEFRGTLWSPLAQRGTLAFPNVERADDVQRVLAHHAHVPRTPPARAILEAVRVGLTRGLEVGLAFEADAFGDLVASADGRAGLDRFLARRSWPLPLRPGGEPR
jgi:enoyl-CoA hydratase/carnithine racemase/NADPH:quinone reductase-like Zn-dependent oxidoreductase